MFDGLKNNFFSPNLLIFRIRLVETREEGKENMQLQSVMRMQSKAFHATAMLHCCVLFD